MVRLRAIPLIADLKDFGPSSEFASHVAIRHVVQRFKSADNISISGNCRKPATGLSGGPQR